MNRRGENGKNILKRKKAGNKERIQIADLAHNPSFLQVHHIILFFRIKCRRNNYFTICSLTKESSYYGTCI